MSKEISSKDRENIIKRIYERMKHAFKKTIQKHTFLK